MSTYPCSKNPEILTTPTICKHRKLHALFFPACRNCAGKQEGK